MERPDVQQGGRLIGIKLFDSKQTVKIKRGDNCAARQIVLSDQPDHVFLQLGLGKEEVFELDAKTQFRRGKCVEHLAQSRDSDVLLA